MRPQVDPEDALELGDQDVDSGRSRVPTDLLIVACKYECLSDAVTLFTAHLILTSTSDRIQLSFPRPRRENPVCQIPTSKAVAVMISYFCWEISSGERVGDAVADDDEPVSTRTLLVITAPTKIEVKGLVPNIRYHRMRLCDIEKASYIFSQHHPILDAIFDSIAIQEYRPGGNTTH